MTDERLALAYQAGVSTLSQQDATLGNLRNRSNGVLTTAALLTSFSAGLGLINTDSSKGATLPSWCPPVLLGLLVVIGCLSMATAWPVKNWSFGASGKDILKRTDAGESEDDIARAIATALAVGISDNSGSIRRRGSYYRISVLVLLIEVVVLVVAIVQA